MRFFFMILIVWELFMGYGNDSGVELHILFSFHTPVILDCRMCIGLAVR